jgi:hypothetical protein
MIFALLLAWDDLFGAPVTRHGGDGLGFRCDVVSSDCIGAASVSRWHRSESNGDKCMSFVRRPGTGVNLSGSCSIACSSLVPMFTANWSRQMSPSIRSLNVEFTCACGVECRIDCEIAASTPAVTRHCDKAEVLVLPGLPQAFYEMRDDEWVEVAAW